MVLRPPGYKVDMMIRGPESSSRWRDFEQKLHISILMNIGKVSASLLMSYTCYHFEKSLNFLPVIPCIIKMSLILFKHFLGPYVVTIIQSCANDYLFYIYIYISIPNNTPSSHYCTNYVGVLLGLLKVISRF